MQRTIVSAFALLVSIGCTTTASVRPSELVRLDGYDVKREPFTEPVLETIDGDSVSVSADSKIYLDLYGTTFGGRFAAIEVRDGVFEGSTDDARPIRMPLADISRATVEKPNNAGTILWAIGGLLAMGMVTLVGFVVVNAQTSGGVEGRPLRVRGKIVAAPLAESEGWRSAGAEPDVSSLSPGARAILAQTWIENARSEHASVPAFSRLSLTLMSLGAPARLVEGAHRAALEEIEHARLAFALAGAYAGQSVAPGALPELRSAPAVTAGSLSELAIESLTDGCLNEGFAAAAATASGARARDVAVREAWSAIARDESSHADLAWDVLQWCLDQGDPALGRRLRKAIHTVPPSVAAPGAPEHLAGELEAHGWLPPTVMQDLFQQTRLAVASRLAARLQESARPRRA
jgi:hypothetical protein